MTEQYYVSYSRDCNLVVEGPFPLDVAAKLARIVSGLIEPVCEHCNGTGIEPDAGTDSNPEPSCTKCNNGYPFHNGETNRRGE